MVEASQHNPGLIEFPDHFRTETKRTPEDIQADNLDLGDRAMRGVVVVQERTPRIVIAEEDVTPQMRANAIGSPYYRDAAGRIVPR